MVRCRDNKETWVIPDCIIHSLTQHAEEKTTTGLMMRNKAIGSQEGAMKHMDPHVVMDKIGRSVNVVAPPRLIVATIMGQMAGGRGGDEIVDKAEIVTPITLSKARVAMA